MKKERTSLRLAELEPNTGQLEWLPKNPRQWTQDDIDRTAKSIAEDYDFLEDRPLLAVPNGNTFVVFAGNLRMTAARQSKVDSVPVIIYTPENDTDQQTILRRAMKDNGSFGAWDWDALANEWDDLPLGDWGVPSWNAEVEPFDSGVEENYSRKIEAPIYEPKGDKVEIADLFDTEKYDELVRKIEAARLPKDIDKFLRMAASRHIVFDYANIAEYYSSAPAEIKELMEDSALVIIDFKKAIEGGFVKMTEALRQEYLRQNGTE